MRAGAIVTGTQAVREAVRGRTVHFVLVAADASENSLNKIVPLLEAVGVPYAKPFDRETLGAAVGRAPLGAIGIKVPSFAEKIRAELGDIQAVQSDYGRHAR